MDQIIIHDLQCYGYHGVFPEENRLGQRFIVNLELEIDLRAAGMLDDLSMTVNYADVIARTRHVVEGKPHQLVETVAESIAAMLLSEFPLLHAVCVQVRKPTPPVPEPFAGVTVSIQRSRQSGGSR